MPELNHVGGRTRMASQPLLGEDGQPLLDEQGRPRTELRPVLDGDGQPLMEGGHRLVIRDRFPAKRFFLLHRLIRWYADGHGLLDRSLEEDVQPYVGTIESWDYAGDPADFAAWQELDVITELPQVVAALNNHILRRIQELGTESKN